MQAIGGAKGVVAAMLVAVAAFTDFKWCRIFNWTTYVAFGWAIAFGAAAELSGNLPIHHGSTVVPLTQVLGVEGLSEVVKGFALCFAIMFGLFVMFGGGAGDVKYIAALGALVGWEGGLYTWVYGVIAAAIFASGLALIRIGPKALLGELFFKLGLMRISFLLGGPSQELKMLFRRRIPMAPFFAVGALTVFLSQ